MSARSGGHRVWPPMVNADRRSAPSPPGPSRSPLIGRSMQYELGYSLVVIIAINHDCIDSAIGVSTGDGPDYDPSPRRYGDRSATPSCRRLRHLDGGAGPP